MSAEQGERCQLCGSLVEVVSSDEGTSYYRPAEQGDAICIHCGAEVFWGLPRPEDPCFECGKPVAEQGDVEATDDDRLERIHRAFEYVPLSLYDEVTKLAEYALGEFIADRNRLEAALERAEWERDSWQAQYQEQVKSHERHVAGKNMEVEIVVARAEKAELALAEMRDALTNIAGYGISPNDGYPVVSADVVKVARAVLRLSEDTE